MSNTNGGNVMMRKVAGAIVVLFAGVGAQLALVSPAHAAGWSDVGSDCHSDGVEGWSKYTWCWAKKKRVNDNTPDYDVFSFRMTSSGNSLDPKYFGKLWVEPQPRSSSPTQKWQGADPFKPDQTSTASSNCKTWSWTIGASAGIDAAFSQSGQVCDQQTFGPKIYSAAGHHASIWQAHGSCESPGVVRKVAAGVLVRVAPGKTPTWSSDKRGANAYSSKSTC